MMGLRVLWVLKIWVFEMPFFMGILGDFGTM